MKRLLLVASCLLGLPLVASQTPSEISTKSKKPIKALSTEDSETAFALPEGLSRSTSIPIIKAAATTLKVSHSSSLGGSPSPSRYVNTGGKSPNNSPKLLGPWHDGDSL
jgi:hypothetical protein